MNITKLISIIAMLSASVSAFAETRYPVDQPFVSTKTRAEVIAEVQQAGGNLGRRNYQDTFSPAAGTVSTKTRAEVTAEIGKNGDNARQNYLNSTR